MLMYFGSGPRDYHHSPIRVFVRERWSFQAVLKGEIAPLRKDGPDLLKSRYLWLCHPGFPHGWTGVAGRPSEVAVFQFTHLPVDLLQRLPDCDFLGFDLTQKQCQQIRDLAQRVSIYWKNPLPGRYLYYEYALLELSILLLENLHPENLREPCNLEQQRRVHKAIHWFEQHMGENPSIEQIGEATGVSSSQLRRDFLSVLQMAPKKAMDDIRLKKALEAIQQTDSTVESIAEQLGFSSSSALSRSFKIRFGRSPRHYGLGRWVK